MNPAARSATTCVPRWLSFSVVLEKVVAARYLLYRVRDGFPQGGILAFDIDRKRAGGGYLTIYVAFNVPRGKNPFRRIAWYLFKRVFPASCTKCSGTRPFASSSILRNSRMGDTLGTYADREQ